MALTPGCHNCVPTLLYPGFSPCSVSCLGWERFSVTTSKQNGYFGGLQLQRTCPDGRCSPSWSSSLRGGVQDCCWLPIISAGYPKTCPSGLGMEQGDTHYASSLWCMSRGNAALDKFPYDLAKCMFVSFLQEQQPALLLYTSWQ